MFVSYCTFNRDRGNGGEQAYSAPREMTEAEVLQAVTEWFRARGTRVDDYEGMQLMAHPDEKGFK